MKKKQIRNPWTCHVCDVTLDSRGRLGHINSRDHKAKSLQQAKNGHDAKPEPVALRRPPTRESGFDSYLAGFADGFYKAREIA